MTSKTATALASAAALAAASLAVAGGPSNSTTRTQTRSEYKYVVTASDDDAVLASSDAPHQIMVTSRAIDGAAPTMQVKVLGEGLDGETIDVGSLEPGETRTFTTKDGKDVVVTRGDAGVKLSVDGKEIELPSLGSLSVLPGDATAIAISGPDGELRTEDANVFVVGAPHVMVAGPGALAGNFDDLESLKDLDPEVREKVVAALHEILSSPAGLAHAFTLRVPAPGEAAAPGAQAIAPHVIVHRQVVKDDDQASGSKME